MSKKRSIYIYNITAPFYNLFYNPQKKFYAKIMEDMSSKLDLTAFDTALDVGCGTGAFCSILNEKGLKVTGIDAAEKMLDIARKKPENKAIQFIKANVVEGLPFDHNSFDISLASYVAHSLQQDERKQMYAEMSRVTREKVIIYDYNQNKSLPIAIVEWLEGGDYLRFIQGAKKEMEDCEFNLKKCFSDVEAINVGPRTAWYICTPN
ncbi:MAG: class I SAM-dependent methyltransferase [Bacillota bacterium]